MNKTNFRSHGDVEFYPVDADKAKGEVVKHNGVFVVELGETTGHKHVLTMEKPEDLVILKDEQGNFYFQLSSPGQLTHEEHATITLEPGTYFKGKEREVDHFSHSIRKVID